MEGESERERKREREKKKREETEHVVSEILTPPLLVVRVEV